MYNQVAYFSVSLFANHSWMRTLSLIFALAATAFCAACGGAPAARTSLPAPATLTGGFVEAALSPDQDVHQGYTTDGVYHYLLDTARIFKRDPAWNTVRSTTTPLAGLTGLDHLGDGDYYSGNLYLAGEHYSNCGDFSHQSILVFGADTLERQKVIDISAQGAEVSGLVIVPEENAIYVSSFCDGSKLWRYDLTTFAPIGTLTLATPVAHIQGITYHGGVFYLSQNEGALFSANANGAVTRVFADTLDAEHEGLDYSQGELRWLIDAGNGQRKIHFLQPN